MIFTTLIPTPPLSEAVDFLWLRHGYRPLHIMERVLPSATVELVFKLDEGQMTVRDRDDLRRVETFSGPLISGAQRRHFIMDTRQQFAVMGASLKPGGAWLLFGIPAGEIAERHLTLDAILGAEAGRWMEQIREVRTHDARLKVLESVLRQRLVRRSHPAIAWAVQQFCDFPAHIRVGEVADEAGLSLRRFNELFTRSVGFNPKSFIRIQRFQSALTRLFSARRVDWCALAGEAGYADQSHFIREFREFTGLTPGEYLGTRGDLMNHVPMAASIENRPPSPCAQD